MKVVEIYESLFQFERNKDKENEGYPIHKKLVFEQKEINDIYDWIINHFQFETGAKILDAGCGVGYGTLKMARYKALDLTGISISPSEVQLAQKNAKKNPLSSNIEFVESNFENAPDKQYDFIIAVESLKHSLDISRSLKALESKLASGGKLVIVEDFYLEKRVNRSGKTLMKDWSLVDLFRISDYENLLTKSDFMDLTDLMPAKNGLVLMGQNIVLTILGLISPSKKAKVYKIFRGGIMLDLLYQKHKMKYGVFVHTKK